MKPTGRLGHRIGQNSNEAVIGSASEAFARWCNLLGWCCLAI